MQVLRQTAPVRCKHAALPLLLLLDSQRQMLPAVAAAHQLVGIAALVVELIVQLLL
jgi:hypothetical protein